MASVLLNPQVIDNYLQSEVQTGREAGPSLPSLSSTRAVSASSPHATNLGNGVLSWTCLALLAIVSTTGLQARTILYST